ncbi:iron-sulfur cluster assembly scaffold protein [Streptomyces chartreusis]|uniref:iron-sulfur cluster assembly scaffold protein n=1 Tax=Streptomyces TaxID=1883 RepID=UPI002E7FC852|nr:iron-sulfur cluster assembly scaffold protein [Streptomyces chartreusis]WUB18297.1 iron-sulfur cluster assembly scaffold protein [Streptomyces chartreusis]
MTATEWGIQALLADHFKNPRNWGMLHRGRHGSGTSPGCGDEQVVYVDETSGRLARVRFQATGCALSRAATSILLEHAEDLPWADVDALDQSFFVETLGRDVVLSRPKCTMLGLSILHNLSPSAENE